VIERWRGSTMSHKVTFNEEQAEAALPIRNEPVPLQAAASLDPQRFKTLRQPREASARVAVPPAKPTSWR